MTTTSLIVTGARTGRAVRAPRRGRRGRALNVIRMIVVFGMLFLTLAPLTWIFVTAFEPDSAVTTLPVSIIPREFTFANVEALFTSTGAGPYIVNSLVATIGSTIAVVLIATPAAYAIARHRFVANSGSGFSLGILAARFIPGFMIIIPLFLMFRDLRLLDSVGALVILYTVMNLPLTVWVILPAARQLPAEIMEAAAVDGAGTTTTFLRIGLPLLRPAIATAATLAMIFAWNEFFVALIFTQVNAQTAPILLSSFFGDSGIQWGQLAATALVVAVPMIILGIVAQRHLVRGLTAGSVK